MTTTIIEPIQKNGFGLSVQDIADMDPCEFVQRLNGPAKQCARCKCGLHESTTGRRLLHEPDGATLEVCSDCYFSDPALFSIGKVLEPGCDGLMTKEQCNDFFAMYLHQK